MIVIITYLNLWDTVKEKFKKYLRPKQKRWNMKIDKIIIEWNVLEKELQNTQRKWKGQDLKEQINQMKN